MSSETRPEGGFRESPGNKKLTAICFGSQFFVGTPALIAAACR